MGNPSPTPTADASNFSQQGTSQELFSQLVRFSAENFLGDDFATIDIHNQIEIPVQATHNGSTEAEVSRLREFHVSPSAFRRTEREQSRARFH